MNYSYRHTYKEKKKSNFSKKEYAEVNKLKVNNIITVTESDKGSTIALMGMVYGITLVLSI